jgi:hypothetical protein
MWTHEQVKTHYYPTLPHAYSSSSQYFWFVSDETTLFHIQWDLLPRGKNINWGKALRKIFGHQGNEMLELVENIHCQGFVDEVYEYLIWSDSSQDQDEDGMIILELNEI